MRFTRLIIGFLVILAALLVIAGEQLAGVSSDAFINARTTTLRAPIAGKLTVVPHLLGSQIARGEELGSIEDGLLSKERLHDLLLEKAVAEAETTRLERLIAAEQDAALQTSSIGQEDAPQGAAVVEELQAKLEAEQTRLSALDKRIDAERLWTTRLGAATLVSNVNGILWEVLAASGETVRPGDPLLRLVDCDTAGVTLSVTEGVYNRLAQGDTAQFRVDNDGRVFQGTVTRLAGSGAETIYRNLAIPPSQRHLERFDVTLYVPALRQDEELKCAVGRTGRVFFDTRPLDFLRRFWG